MIMEQEMPTIKGELIIFSDSIINFNEMQHLIKVNPTETMQKGDKIRENLFAKNSRWLYSTNTIETFDIRDVSIELMNIIKDKYDELSYYLKEKLLNIKFGFVIRYIAGNSFPAIYFEHDFIEMCNLLKAEIDIDVLV